MDTDSSRRPAPQEGSFDEEEAELSGSGRSDDGRFQRGDESEEVRGLIGAWAWGGGAAGLGMRAVQGPQGAVTPFGGGNRAGSLLLLQRAVSSHAHSLRLPVL